MSEDMVKKSVDITQEDEDWLENSHINFSKFVRRKIAEKRATSIKDSTKEELYQDVEKVIEIGKGLREEWDNFEEELAREYDADIVLKDDHAWEFEIDGERYGSDYGGQEANSHEKDPQQQKQADEFASKYGGKWQSILGEFIKTVEEKTCFQKVDWNPMSNTFEAEYGFNTFTLKTTNLPSSRNSIDVEFESRVHIEIQDLEKSVEAE